MLTKNFNNFELVFSTATTYEYLQKKITVEINSDIRCGKLVEVRNRFVPHALFSIIYSYSAQLLQSFSTVLFIL